MAQLNLRKRGTKWEYRFEGATIDGKRKQYTKSGFATKKEAEKAGIIAMNEYNNSGRAFVPSEISYSDFLNDWLNTICTASLNSQTIESYKKRIRLYISPKLGHYKIKSLNAPILQSFINDLYNERFSRNTLSNIKAILSSSLDYAVEPMKYIAVNPMQYVKLPSKRITKNQSREQPHFFIPDNEIREIFERFPEGTSTHIPMMLGYKCGLRLGEAFAVCWDDIDFDNKTLSVNKQVQWHGGINQYWYFANPKYDSFRTITLDDGLIDLLHREKERQEKYENFLEDKYIRFFESNSRIINTQNDGKRIYPICIREDGSYIQPRTMQHTSMVIHKQLGINFTFHSLRHTHCSLLLSAGATPKYVQERLGHKNIQVTLGIYQHLTNQMKQDGDNILNNLYNK